MQWRRIELSEENNKCEVQEPKKKKFDASQIVRKADDTTSDQSKRYLRWLCEKGIEKFIMPKLQNPDFPHTEEEYRERLEYELDVIEGMGYVDYFLIVQDYVNYAKNHGMPTGPGRGCLVPETSVLTDKGFITLKDINVGHFVYDEKGKKVKILQKFEYDIEEEMITIETVFDKVKMTLDHKIPKKTENDIVVWLESQNINIGDEILYFDGKEISYTKVINIKREHYKGKVIDIGVDTNNEPSYATSGCIVHNSAAGCLVSYLIGITSIDPIPYGLYFERFLNPGRKGMPDIDVDFPQSKRQEIIEHIRKQYGTERVAQIATFSYIGGRGSVRDAARILGYPAEFGDKVAKMISEKPKAKIADDLVEGTELYSAYRQNPDVKKVIDTAMSLEGFIRQGSIHASALVIAPVDITDKMPMQTPKKSQVSKDGDIDESTMLVQFDGPTVENLGYLKMDILGLGTLDVIENTLAFIEKHRGIKLTLEDIPFDDKKTFELLSSGDTNGVFQVESSGMKGVLKDIKPTKFEEIADIIALYRPGPMEYIPIYREGKLKPEKIKYITPELKPILDDTYGVACIAENSMVTTRNGLKKIQDVQVGDSVITEDGSFQKCLGVWDKGKKKTLRIRTDFGEEIICTPDHKILTQLGWVEAKDLTKSHLIKSFNPVLEQKNFEEFNWYDWMIGLFLADGHSIKGCPNIACHSEDFAYRVKNIIEECFPTMKNIHIGSKNNGLGTTWYVYIAQKQGNNGKFNKNHEANEFNNFLKKNDLYLKTGNDKKWPEKYSISTIIGFLEGDGCYINRRVNLKHYDLAHGLYSALLSYGIRASFFRRDESAWSVAFDLVDILKPKVKECSYKRESRGYYIPKSYLYPYKEQLPRIARKNHLNSKRNIPYILQQTAERYGWESKESHILWGRVLSIKEDIKRKVYDLSIEKNHSFLVGGSIVHNCYQEQLMEIAKEIGGFTLAEADDLRKAISKKKYELLVKIEEKFYAGCKRNGIPDKVIPELWKLMEAASGYSFNKSHAFCYAVLAYQTAYLKANYTIEFMTALLTYKKDDQDVIKEYVNDCKKYDIKVIPPHINYSNIDFDITPRGEISFGLSALKGVGYGPAIEIVDGRENNGQYKDINDFLSRIKINSRVYEILASAGALDNLGWTRKALIEDKEKVVTFIKNINKKVDVGLQVGFDFFDEIEKATIETYIKDEYKPDYLLNMEYETLGMYLTGHPIQYYNISRRLKMKGISPKILKNISQLPSLKDKDEVYVFGVVQNIRRWESKKGWMAFVTLADFGSGEESYEGDNPKFYTFDVVLFADAYSNWGYKMRDNDFLGIKGKMNIRKETGQLSMIAEEITFPIKDTDIEYENDPLMRKIVMDVLEDMRKEKEGLLPHNIEKQKMIDEDKIKEDNEKNQEKRKLKAVVTEDNYQDLVSLVESNPGDILVYAVLNGEMKEMGGMRFNKKTHLALDFAGIEIFPM